MVLTPRFHLTQTSHHVLIHVNIPNIRITGMEMTVIDQSDFSFYCRPYLLRLQLPGQVAQEDDMDETKHPRASFDPNVDKGTVTIYLTKVKEGVTFEGLEMISMLLKTGAVRPRLGTGRYGLGVDGQGAYGFMNGFRNFFGEDGFLEEFPDLIDLPHPDETSVEARTMLREIHEDAMFDCERYRADLFGGEDDDIYQAAMSFKPEWSIRDVNVTGSQNKINLNEVTKSLESMTVNDKFVMTPSAKGSTLFTFGSPSSVNANQSGTFTFGSNSPSLFQFSPISIGGEGESSFIESPFKSVSFSAKIESTSSGRSPLVPSTGSTTDSASFFTEKEQRQLTLLSARDFNESEVVIQCGFYKLLDVLLGYCYETRITCGEFTVESHWTIRKLSATLSWLEEFKSLEQVLKSFSRRSLCFPYMRRWDLACQVGKDCLDLLQDEKQVIRALLRVQDCFRQSQTAYLLNRLFIDDMIVFAQSTTFKQINKVDSIWWMKWFDATKGIPAIESIGWNLSLASSTNSVDAKVLKRSHLEGISPKPKPIKTKNVIEELD